MNHWSGNQIAVITLYFHCSLTAKVSSVTVETEQKIEKSNQDYEYYLQKSKQSYEPFKIDYVSEKEVLQTITKMSNKASEVPDNISYKILKKINLFIIKELTICINKSFEEECFPEILKITKTTPIFKKLDR